MHPQRECPQAAQPAESPALEALLARAASLIQRANALVIAAGAGMAVDAGLPCLGSDEALWHAYPGLRGNGLGRAQLDSPRLFAQAPATAWGFHGLRLQHCRRATPHAGYLLLRDWAQRMPHGAFVFTSNGDGHFQKAGFAAARVHECHGSLHRLQCSANCRGATWSSASLPLRVAEATCQWLGPLPRCPDCGAPARPNVQLQDDEHWCRTRSAQQRMLFEMWLDAAPAPLVLEIGAGTAMPTVRNLTRRLQARGSQVIRINLHEAGPSSSQGLAIQLGARQALARIAQHMAGR